MRLSTLEARVASMEKREAARPFLPTICLNLAGRDAQRFFVNGKPIDREPGETSQEFLTRARQSCPKSKSYVSLVTSIPPHLGEQE